mmetsp:Transcript_5877/g.18888  ORF Transcript_5877/g.18888 Transcript_5877/m.18888 type:complete len:382 (+) Transcript_5877:623-1768(+)
MGGADRHAVASVLMAGARAARAARDNLGRNTGRRTGASAVKPANGPVPWQRRIMGNIHLGVGIFVFAEEVVKVAVVGPRGHAGKLALMPFAHDLHELVGIDLASELHVVAVSALAQYLVHNLIDVLPVLELAGEQLANLVDVNQALIVDVKLIEGVANDNFVVVKALVEHCRNELVEVHFARAVEINRLKNFPRLGAGDLVVVDELIVELLEGDVAVRVLVEVLEGVLKLFDLFVREAERNGLQRNFTKVRGLGVVAQATHKAAIDPLAAARGSVRVDRGRAARFHGEPWVLERLFGGHAQVDILYEAAAHEILGLCGHGRPDRSVHRVHSGEGRRHDLLLRLAFERGRAREEHKCDDSERPHVALDAVVFAKHLRGDVVG